MLGTVIAIGLALWAELNNRYVRSADEREQRFRGRYVLQRTVVDGASADQRAWRIGSASLGEVR